MTIKKKKAQFILFKHLFRCINSYSYIKINKSLEVILAQAWLTCTLLFYIISIYFYFNNIIPYLGVRVNAYLIVY